MLTKRVICMQMWVYIYLFTYCFSLLYLLSYFYKIFQWQLPYNILVSAVQCSVIYLYNLWSYHSNKSSAHITQYIVIKILLTI